jgi:hypothetical protein
MKRISGLGSALALLLTAFSAEAQTRPTVVELFTSEGCSSCPPAEAMIGVLAKRRPDVIALAFHVDYWDYIGWKDRFEIPEATERQHQYTRALHLNTVYTPQWVVDGRRDVVGNDDASTVPAGGQRQSFPLDIAVHEARIDVSIGASGAGSMPTGVNDVVLLSYLPEGVSRIARGENAGRELHEFNIVRSIHRLGTWKGEAAVFTLPLKALPADATQVVVLVQAAEGPIIGAAAHALQ